MSIFEAVDSQEHHINNPEIFWISGLNYAQGWNRTADIRIFSPPLYQLSYRGM